MAPFWKSTPLVEMTSRQWESLCDGCGWCCLEKAEDPETGAITLRGVACEHLALPACRCEIYPDRFRLNPQCVSMAPQREAIMALTWLPDTCAYRLVAEGRELPSWHPLISGDPDSVHLAGESVRHQVVSGKFVHPEDLE